MKLLKSGLLAFGALALIAAGVLVYLTYFFDPRDFEPRIAHLVKEKTGRTLHFEGKTGLSFWPDIGIRFGPVSLSEPGTDERFASVAEARLALKLLPLLSGKLVADAITVQGAHARIVRHEDGRLNVDDLLQGEGDLHFDIGRVTVRSSSIAYLDLATRKQYELSAIALRTGRLARAVETAIQLEFHVKDTANTFGLDCALKGRFAFDSEQGLYALHEAKLDLSGHVPGVSALEGRAGGTLKARIKESEVSAEGVTAAMKGAIRGDTVEATMKASRVVAAKARAVGDTVAIHIGAMGAGGATRVNLALPRLERIEQVLKAEAVSLGLEIDRAGHAAKADVMGSLEADLAQRRVVLNALETQFVLGGPRTPGGHIQGTAKGSASLDVGRETVALELAGKVADSSVKARLAATGFAAPRYAFDVFVDQLDLDRYTGQSTRKNGAAAKAGPDLSTLDGLTADGLIHIGVLKSGGVEARNVKLALKQ